MIKKYKYRILHREGEKFGWFVQYKYLPLTPWFYHTTIMGNPFEFLSENSAQGWINYDKHRNKRPDVVTQEIDG